MPLPASLTAEQAEEARKFYKEGYTYLEIAKYYGCAKSTASRAVNRVGIYADEPKPTKPKLEDFVKNGNFSGKSDIKEITFPLPENKPVNACKIDCGCKIDPEVEGEQYEHLTPILSEILQSWSKCGLSWYEICIIKYSARRKGGKEGRIRDMNKIIKYATKIIDELEEFD